MFTAIRKLLSPKAEPRPLAAETAHPVMRAEPGDSFGWLDGPDAQSAIARRARSGEIGEADAGRLRAWARDGYTVFAGLLPHALVDEALADVDRVWRERPHVGLDVLTTGERTYLDEADPSAREVPHKLVDLYLHLESVRRIFFHPEIVRFGELVFGEGVVGCNSLTFRYGSEQPAHVDHVYMTPPRPRRLMASWVALEDVRPEAGPLELWAGSHQLPPFDFGGGRYHFTPEQEAEHTRYVAEQKARFPKHEFLAHKGDVLVWHGMLIHGGGPIRDRGATRQSMAFHYYSRACVGGANEPLAAHGQALYLTKA